MSDDDTDVIFEGSPLYQHLRNVGLEDFEVAEKLAVEEISSAVTLRAARKECILTRWKKKINIASRIKIAFFKDTHTLRQILGEKISCLILDSSLLMPTDRLLLQDFSCTRAEKQTYSFIQKYFCLVAVLASYGITKFGTDVEISNTLDAVLLFLLCGITLVFAVQIVSTFVCWRLTSRVQESIKNAIEVFAELKAQFRKGIRDIQETELIARGFTLASIVNPISRLESSNLPVKTSEKQCPEYRSFVFTTLKICFLQYRELTLDMMNSCPLSSEVDIPSYYVACVSLKELGPIFGKETTDDELIEFTNDYSVSSLKLVFQIMELQQSELLRRIGLCFLNFSGDSKDFSAVTFLPPRLEQFTVESHALVSKLRRFQLFNSRIHLEESPISATKTKIQTDVQKFQVAMHSISLHLQAAILRLQKLEEQKDNCLEKLDELLVEVRGELDASYVCLEESASHLSSMKGEKPQVCKLPPILVPTSPEDDQIKGPPIPIFEMDEPIVEDQVFEATTTVNKNESEQVEAGVDDDFWIEEKARRKAEKEASRHLFKELKSILVVKAEEHRAREERALLGQHHACNEKVSSEVPSTESSTIPEDCAEETLQTSIDLLKDVNLPYKTPLASPNQSKENNEMDVKTSVQIPETIASVPVQLFHPSRVESQFGGDFSLAASVAAQAAQRSKLLGFKVDTIGDDCFGDSSDTD